MNRRAFLGGITAAVATGAAGAALARRSDEPVLRVGVMTNLTHAPMLAGLGSGRIARALGSVRVEPRIFRAGPRVAEALLGAAIDVGTAGPAAIVIHQLRHSTRAGAALRVLTGCASGGASFVVGARSGIRRPDDLRGKRIAIAQIGTTQDVALRTYLRAHGLRDAAAGGDVTVVAIATSAILEEMRRGGVHGAWLAEPWATRAPRELEAVRLIDERELWPERAFCTAALVTRADCAEHPHVERLARALDEEILRARSAPETTLAEAYAELRKHVGNPGARSVFEAAARFVDFTSDPVPASFVRFASDVRALGLVPANGGDDDVARVVTEATAKALFSGPASFTKRRR